MPRVSEQQFREILQSHLGSSWDRALAVFRNCGENLEFEVTNVLRHAVDQGKVNEVLGILEEHYQSHLQFQHPDTRGTVNDRLLGVNLTEMLFRLTYQQTLGLQINPE